MQAFEERCRLRRVPVTVQRRLILEVMLNLDTHPTAEEVCEAVAARQPGISRATVYRTLESLVQLGELDRASHPGPVVRYDARTERHHHLLCERCNRILDFSHATLDALPVPDVSGLGFEVTNWTVHLRGVCRDCRKKEVSR